MILCLYMLARRLFQYLTLCLFWGCLVWLICCESCACLSWPVVLKVSPFSTEVIHSSTLCIYKFTLRPDWYICACSSSQALPGLQYSPSGTQHSQTNRIHPTSYFQLPQLWLRNHPPRNITSMGLLLVLLVLYCWLLPLGIIMLYSYVHTYVCSCAHTYNWNQKVRHYIKFQQAAFTIPMGFTVPPIPLIYNHIYT